MDELPIVAGGREIPAGLDRIRRYCGLSWSGGPPETWGWCYYDAIATPHDDHVTASDVLCAAALHPGLSRVDLAFFKERARELSAWLADMPTGLRLSETTDGAVEHLTELPNRFPEVSLTVLSKVLHRKRPDAIPLLDRHIVDWYRPVTGKRVIGEAWPSIVKELRNDGREGEQRLLDSVAFGRLTQELCPDNNGNRPRLSWIRAIDIAIWMGSR